MKTEPEVFSSIQTGDYIGAVDSRHLRVTGTVEIADHDHGTAWILSSNGERKLVDVWEHVIQKL